MKSNIFFKVLGKTTIEIDESASVIIPKLYAQNGQCFEFDSEGYSFYFHCTKRGKIYVFRGYGSSSLPDSKGYKRPFEIHRDDPYRIIGKTCEFNYKTIITLYSVKERGSLINVLIPFIIAVLFAVIYTFVYIKSPGELPSGVLIYPALFVIAAFCSLSFLNTKNKNCKNDLKKMKEAAIYRIKATQLKDEEY